MNKYVDSFDWVKSKPSLEKIKAIIASDFDYTKVAKTGINITADISYRDVAAEEEFDLSMYEFMYLLLQDEYAGSCLCDAEKEHFILSIKCERYLVGDIKLPIPSGNTSNKNRPRTIIQINHINQDGVEEIKQEYTRFAPLMVMDKNNQ